MIPITGVPSTFRVPGAYGELLFAQGPASASAGIREVVLVMPKLAASGSWTANTVYPIPDEKTAKDGAGVGSPMHRAALAFLRANKNAKLYGLPYLPSSGGSPAAATGTITLANQASGTGTVEVVIAGESCQASFVSGDSAATIGAALVASINAKEHLPCAASGTDVITLTAKVVGLSQGDGTTGVIHMRGSITTGVATTITLSGAALGLGAGTDGADGTTTEIENLTAALAVLDADRKYHIVVSVWSAAQLAPLKAHVASKSEPRPGLRSVGIAANTGALAACQTIATGLNYERLQIAWCEASEWDTASIAANVAAIRQKREEVDPAFNFDSYRQADWLVPATHLQANWPDSDDLNDAINDGITPIASDSRGSYVVFSATTRSKNAGGTVDDPRALESHRVSVADAFMDEELAEWALNYSGKRLKPDETLADGSVNTNQKIPPGTLTPHTFKDHIRRRLDRYGDRGLLKNISDSQESLRAMIDPNNAGRIQVGLDLCAIDLAHQMTLRMAEVSTG
jgi:phage tail sheath gpL-like